MQILNDVKLKLIFIHTYISLILQKLKIIKKIPQITTILYVIWFLSLNIYNGIKTFKLYYNRIEIFYLNFPLFVMIGLQFRITY